MVQGTIADQASQFAIPVAIRIDGRKLTITGADGVWTDSIGNVQIEAITPTTFRIHFEGTDWTFVPDNPLDAHFELLDPWTHASSSRRRRIRLGRTKPASQPPGSVAVERAETGGIEIESIVAPIDDLTYEDLPVLDENSVATTVAGGLPVEPAGTPTVQPAELADGGVTTDSFHFVEAVRTDIDAATTTTSDTRGDADVHSSRDADSVQVRLPQDHDEASPESPEATAGPTTRVDPVPTEDAGEATGDATADSSEACLVEGDGLHVFIDIDAIPKPDARDPFGGEELPAPVHRTLEETSQDEASQIAESGDDAGPTEEAGATAAAQYIAADAARRLAGRIRAGGQLVWRFPIWMWATARLAIINGTRAAAAATAGSARRVRSVAMGSPAERATFPGEVGKGQGPKMCVDVHAWSISSHGLLRVARCLYCDEVRMDSEQSTSDAAPKLQRFKTPDPTASPARPVLTEI